MGYSFFFRSQCRKVCQEIFRPGREKSRDFYVLGLKQEGNLFRPQGSIGYFSDLEGRKEKSPRSGENFSVVF